MCRRRAFAATAVARTTGWLGALFAACCVVAVAGLATPARATVNDTPSPTDGGVGLRLLDTPTSESGDPRAQLYIIDHLAPGATIRRRVEVSNSTAANTSVVLYSAAASIGAGTFVVSDAHTPNELSTWTSVTPDTADLAAGARATATVTMSVPSDASPGERYGVVWAETRAAPASGGVTQVNRVGIRLYVSIGPGGPPAADFSIDSVSAERSPAGQPTIVASVHNTGGRALDMSGTLLLSSGPGALNAGPFAATLGTTLAIGATEPIAIALDQRLPNGPWDTEITLRSGLLSRTVHATVTFPDHGMAQPVATRSAPVGRPVGVAVAVVAAFASGGLALVVRRRRARSEASGIC